MNSYLTIRDIIYIVVYFVSMGITIGGFIYRLKQLESDCGRVKKTLYLSNGGLNTINSETCKIHRDQIFTAIRKGERISDAQTKELRILNERILRIMIHLKIDTDKSLV